MSPATQPAVLLAAVDAVRYCDTPQAHELRIITDGHRVYAHGPVTDAGPAYRYLTEVTVVCGQPGIDDHPCDGTATVDLAEPGVWVVPSDSTRALLRELGTAVDQ